MSDILQQIQQLSEQARQLERHRARADLAQGPQGQLAQAQLRVAELRRRAQQAELRLLEAEQRRQGSLERFARARAEAAGVAKEVAACEARHRQVVQVGCQVIRRAAESVLLAIGVAAEKCAWSP